MHCCIKRDSEEIAFQNAHILLQQKIPRPPNAFMLYANENRKSVAQMHPAESNKEISKRLGSNWKTLELHEKSKYFERAKAIDLEHKKKYPNYVYNPKEARIRKAMREATRDRSIGASPMLPRPSARRATHGWVGTHHEEQLMMSPLSAGMRGGLESPVCFPITNGSGSNQFMPPMNGGGGYTKLESPMSVSNSVHNNYLQPNPLAQLQQQTEMWHNYQETMRPRSSGNSYMIQEVASSPYSQQHLNADPNMLMENNKQHQQRQTHSVNSNTSNTSMPLTPPHSNENVPPDEAATLNEKCMSGGGGPDASNDGFESKHAIEAVVGQPLMENNFQQQQQSNDGYLTQLYQMPQQFEGAKVKKVNTKLNTVFLPLSCTNICVSPELLNNSAEWQAEYIYKYFQTTPDYEITNVVCEDGITIPYVDSKTSEPVDISIEPNYVLTDVGFVPMIDRNLGSVVDLTKDFVKNADH